jgi:hypothetical protein
MQIISIQEPKFYILCLILGIQMLEIISLLYSLRFVNGRPFLLKSCIMNNLYFNVTTW